MKKERENTETTEQTVQEKLVFRKQPEQSSGELRSSRTTVSFIESGTPERENPAARTSDRRNSEPVYDSTPKIRRMSDSTRAREAEKNRKNQQKGKAPEEENYTY